MKTIEEIKQDKELQKYFKKSSTFARIIKHGYDIVELYQAMFNFQGIWVRLILSLYTKP